MPAQSTLTAQLILELCERIKAGAFEHVAAESLGVSQETYRDWLARGRVPEAEPLYRDLDHGARQARAHARLMAEMELRTSAPKAWLLHGPGRDTGAAPGWSAATRAPAADKDGTLNVFAHPEIIGLLHSLGQALAPYGEAKKAVEAVLAHPPRA
jgi:hypothetical protein